MTEFQLFNKVLVRYETVNETADVLKALKLPYSEEVTDSKSSSCYHSDVSMEKGISICVDCGEEISQKKSHKDEWRGTDLKKEVDPSRVQARKMDDRNIYRDVESLGFSENIVNKANKIYGQVTDGKIYRGNSRKAIIFACIFHSLKLSGIPLSHERLINIFKLNRKTGLKGLKHVNLHAPKDSEIRTTYITPQHLLDELMGQFDATEQQKQEVRDLYTQIHNKSSKLNRSRPKSVSSSLVFYWICKKKIDISLKDFTKKIGLSELTITKIAKEIADVLGTPDVIV